MKHGSTTPPPTTVPGTVAALSAVPGPAAGGTAAASRATDAPVVASPAGPGARRGRVFRAPLRAGGRLGAVAVLGVGAAALALALSGCGIRDTALPVDAGDAASRTACPPAPDATLSKLASDETILPPGPAQEALSPEPLSPEVQASIKRGLLPAPPSARAEAWSRAEAQAKAKAAASASPTAVPSATDSDGTLSCLRVTATATPTSSTTASP